MFIGINKNVINKYKIDYLIVYLREGCLITPLISFTRGIFIYNKNTNRK